MTNISISLPDAELLDLKASAAAQGITVSEYIRGVLNKKVSKIRQAIREQNRLNKSLMMAVSCMKKETYDHDGVIYHYLYEVNHVFVMDDTLYPIYQGHCFPEAIGTIGRQSILFAILCTIPINGAIGNVLWDDLIACFKPLMKGIEKDNEFCIVFNNFTFERSCSSVINLYNYYLTKRD